MNAKLRKLLEDRARAWSQVQDIQARREQAGYTPSDEDGETYTRALDDVERLSKEIETEDRAARLQSVMDAPAGDVRSTNPVAGAGEGQADDVEAYRKAYGSFLRRGIVDLEPEERRLLQTGFVNDPDMRALGSGGSAGGYTVPTGFLQRMVETMKAYGGLFGVADVINTESGNELPWPTNDDTGNKGAILAENAQVTEQDMVFGQAKLGAYMFTSKLVRVPFQLLQDSAFDLEAWLPVRLGARIGRGAADYFATGTGTSQPKGLITGLTLNVETSTASKIVYDDLVDLEHKVDPAYRNTGRCRYVLHDSALRAIRKIKDSQGRPLWVPQMAGGVPSTINGQPYTVDNSLAELADNAKPIAFGDIGSALVIRVVAGAQTMRLAERYADYLQVGFFGFQRLDSTVQDASAAATLSIKPAA
jgi:HK97 family phage major capsid protein